MLNAREKEKKIWISIYKNMINVNEKKNNNRKK